MGVDCFGDPAAERRHAREKGETPASPSAKGSPADFVPDLAPRGGEISNSDRHYKFAEGRLVDPIDPLLLN